MGNPSTRRVSHHVTAIYHLASRQDWNTALTTGIYEVPSLAAEGFIHASCSDQVVASANRHYGGHRDLVLLVIDEDAVDPKVIREDTSGRGELYPHIYGQLNTAAVTDALDFMPDDDGTFAESLTPVG
jgi:uncharacterized protein (DUF952 family)